MCSGRGWGVVRHMVRIVLRAPTLGWGGGIASSLLLGSVSLADTGPGREESKKTTKWIQSVPDQTLIYFPYKKRQMQSLEWNAKSDLSSVLTTLDTNHSRFPVAVWGTLKRCGVPPSWKESGAGDRTHGQRGESSGAIWRVDKEGARWGVWDRELRRFGHND